MTDDARNKARGGITMARYREHPKTHLEHLRSLGLPIIEPRPGEFVRIYTTPFPRCGDPTCDAPYAWVMVDHPDRAACSYQLDVD